MEPSPIITVYFITDIRISFRFLSFNCNWGTQREEENREQSQQFAVTLRCSVDSGFGRAPEAEAEEGATQTPRK